MLKSKLKKPGENAMPKKQTKNQKIFNALNEKLSKNPNCSWKELSAAVTAAAIPIKNWRTVRGVLQFMLNEKMVARTNNLHHEIYYKLA